MSLFDPGGNKLIATPEILGIIMWQTVRLTEIVSFRKSVDCIT